MAVWLYGCTPRRRTVRDCLFGWSAKVLKSRNVSVTDSEIQNAGELFEMEQEIAQLEEAVIQEETEKAHAGT